MHHNERSNIWGNHLVLGNTIQLNGWEELKLSRICSINMAMRFPQEYRKHSIDEWHSVAAIFIVSSSEAICPGILKLNLWSLFGFVGIALGHGHSSIVFIDITRMSLFFLLVLLFLLSQSIHQTKHLKRKAVLFIIDKNRYNKRLIVSKSFCSPLFVCSELTRLQCEQTSTSTQNSTQNSDRMSQQ